jgi:hypothetical protein
MNERVPNEHFFKDIQQWIMGIFSGWMRNTPLIGQIHSGTNKKKMRIDWETFLCLEWETIVHH